MLKLKDGKLTAHAFCVAVDTEDGVSPETISLKLADSLTWLEGVGNVEVEYLGELDIIDDVPVTVKDSDDFPPMKES